MFTRMKDRATNLGDWWIMGVLLLIIIVFSLINSNFLSVSNWVNTSTFMTDILLLALAETLVILTGGIDLSVGAIMGLSHILTAMVLEYGQAQNINPTITITIAIFVGLLSGVVVGVLNGILITKLRITPLIATLGMAGVCTGLTFILSGGVGIVNLPPVIGTIGNHVFFNLISFSLLIAGIMVIFISVLLNKTRFGRYTYAIGSNKEAALRSGVNVDLHLIKIYALSGLLCAIAGILLVMRFVNGSPMTGSNMELNAIAAVVIGGTSLYGGVGRVSGSVAGSAITAVMITGLVLAQVSPYWQTVAIGGIIILAVYIDQTRKKSQPM